MTITDIELIVAVHEPEGTKVSLRFALTPTDLAT